MRVTCQGSSYLCRVFKENETKWKEQSNKAGRCALRERQIGEYSWSQIAVKGRKFSDWLDVCAPHIGRSACLADGEERQRSGHQRHNVRMSGAGLSRFVSATSRSIRSLDFPADGSLGNFRAPPGPGFSFH
jgi:hypothetical protein